MEGKEISTVRVNERMIIHAQELADEVEASTILVYIDVIRSHRNWELLSKDRRSIFAVRDIDLVEQYLGHQELDDRFILVPHLNLSRASQIKVAVMLAFSNGFIKKGDRLICLSGSPKLGILDNLLILDIGRELEVFQSADLSITSSIIKSYVFDRLLRLSLELTEEGKERKSIGTIFVLGDHEKVLALSSQMIINPFQAVPEDQRNIMDPRLKETIREFSALDGAFVISDEGVIIAAGRHLKASAEPEELPQGLGSRHRAAAGITAVSNAVAIAISESTGDVRIFSNGRIFMEIEKKSRE